MTTLPHPAWCNRKHKAGANPNRQEHENVWRSDGTVLPLKVSSYLSAACSRQPAGAGLDISTKFNEVRVWLTADEIRSLADRLNVLADMASSIESREVSA